MASAIAVERLIKKAGAALKKGDAQGAAQQYRRAIELNAKSHKALAGYGEAAMKLGDPAEALRAGMAALQAAPTSTKAFSVAAGAAMALRNWPQLVQLGEAWRAAHPRNAEAIRSLAHGYFELGNPDKARDVYYELVQANAGSADHWATYARLCLTSFDYDGAEAALEKAHTLGSPSADSLYALARVKLFLGDLDEAESLSAEAMKKNSKFALAFTQYTTLRGGEVDDETLQQIMRLANDASQHPEHRASLFFANGDIHHRRGDYALAMQAYDQGNQLSNAILSKEGMAYQPAVFERQRAREQAAFRILPKETDFTAGPARPIFVVGMPRSGTTLMESILAAHPDVYGAGELHSFPAIHNNALQWSESNGGKALADAPKDQLQKWRDQYFASYPKLRGEGAVVDKQPLNFRGAGLIEAVFPEAKIIHIRRNPVDTGFSIYRNDFAKAWPYATRLESIAHFYGEYARIAAHWEERLGEAFPLFQYERVVAEFEAEARRLIGVCSLDWRDECLEFHQVKRPVATFSSTQVRQPMRRSTISAREQYGELLRPLTEGLEDAGVDLETGALAPKGL
ncbi:MAG: sulfotransferase [Pseudomonadota bacterium]